MEYHYPKFTPEMKKTHTILIPNMAVTQFRLMEYALRCEGYKCELLGNCGSAVAQLGLKYVHNDTCYPALLTERMTLLTTKLVILMKLIYRDKIMGEGLHATTTSLAEIRRYGKETNLITRRLTAQEWQEALILMKTHQMIELPSAIGNLEDDSPIYIYSTINIFCSAADINELVEMFKGETGETEEQREAEYSEKTQDQWETQDEMRSE